MNNKSLIVPMLIEDRELTRCVRTIAKGYSLPYLNLLVSTRIGAITDPGEGGNVTAINLQKIPIAVIYYLDPSSQEVIMIGMIRINDPDPSMRQILLGCSIMIKRLKNAS